QLPSGKHIRLIAIEQTSVYVGLCEQAVKGTVDRSLVFVSLRKNTQQCFGFNLKIFLFLYSYRTENHMTTLMYDVFKKKYLVVTFMHIEERYSVSGNTCKRIGSRRVVNKNLLRNLENVFKVSAIKSSDQLDCLVQIRYLL